MKTYEQMARSVLSKRDAYDEKKRKGDRIRMTVAGALAALMIINAMILVPVIVRRSKGPDIAPADTQTAVITEKETTNTPPESTTEKNGETTQADTTDVTNEPEDTRVAYVRELKDPENTGSDNAHEFEDPENARSVYVPAFEIVEDDERLQKYEVVFSNEQNGARHPKRLLYVSEAEKVKTYRIRYNDQVYYNWEFYDYDKRPDRPNYVKILISNENNVKMISPEIMTLDLINGSAEFELSFEYAEKTNAVFYLYTYPTIDNTEELSEYDPHRIKSKMKCSVATVKGKDFLTWGNATGTYRFASIYYGDIDENGQSLYEKDPYMPEYYDNPWCELERKVPHVIV